MVLETGALRRQFLLCLKTVETEGRNKKTLAMRGESLIKGITKVIM